MRFGFYHPLSGLPYIYNMIQSYNLTLIVTLFSPQLKLYAQSSCNLELTLDTDLGAVVSDVLLLHGCLIESGHRTDLTWSVISSFGQFMFGLF